MLMTWAMSWDGGGAGRNRIDGLFSAICVRQHSRSFHAASRPVFIITERLTCQLHVRIGLDPPRKAEAEEADAEQRDWRRPRTFDMGDDAAWLRRPRLRGLSRSEAGRRRPCVTDRVAAALRSAAAAGLGLQPAEFPN